MAQWGRNDQAATVNTTTTAITSNGAPINIAARLQVGGGPNAHFANTTGTRANAILTSFGNTTPGAFTNNMAIGIYGIDRLEQANYKEIAHAGWVMRKAGTGPVISITASPGGTGYNNTDIIKIASTQAGGNATATPTTNTTGGIVSITITNPGAGFTSINVSGSVSVTNATGGATGGSGATFTATAGGRAGRVHYETLVASGTVGSQRAVDGTPVLVTDGDSL